MKFDTIWYHHRNTIENTSVKFDRKKFKLQLPINFNGNGRARLTTPSGFFIAKSSIPSAGYGAWTKTKVRKYTVLGEYEGEEHKIEGNSPYSWVVCTYISIYIVCISGQVLNALEIW